MRFALKQHPDSGGRAVRAIAVEAAREAAGFSVEFVMTGAIERVKLAPPAISARADELWLTTCFEAFVGEEGASYREFNFAPSTRWAAYAFDGYRAGMRNIEGVSPAIETRGEEGRFVLHASIAAPISADARFGFSAVVEETSGEKSYWALAHGPGKPDFHHADAFAARLPLEQT